MTYFLTWNFKKYNILLLCMMATLGADYYVLFLVYIAIALSVSHCRLMQQVRHMFDEIDYVLEGKNAERFASLYCWSASKLNICTKNTIFFDIILASP